MKKLLVTILLLILHSYCFSQKPLWLIQVGNGNNIQIQDFSVDSDGNSYCTGYFWGLLNTTIGTFPSSGLSDAFVLKVNPNGKLLWVKTFGNSQGDDGAIAIFIGNGNSIFLTGFCYNSFSIQGHTVNGNGYAIRLDKNGDCQWATGFNNNAANGKDILENNGNVYVLGEYQNTLILGTDTLSSIGSVDLFIAELNSAGTPISGSSIASIDREYASTISVLDSTNIIVSGGNEVASTIQFGSIQTLPGGHFLAIYNTSSKTWIHAKNIASLAYTILYSTVDEQKNIYATGGFQGLGTFDTIQLNGSNTFNELFVARFDSALNVIWAVMPSSSNDIYTTGIEVSPKSEIYLSGTFGNQTIFGNDTLVNSGSNGIEDLYVSKLNDSGTWIKAKSFGGNRNEVAHGFSVNSIGTTYMAGLFVDTLNFGPLSVSSTSASGDIYIAKLIDDSDSLKRRIEGNVSWDKNADCNVDTADYFFPYSIVKATPGPLYGITDQNGIYKMFADSSNYLVEQIPIGNSWIQACQLNYNVNLTTNSTSPNINFENLQTNTTCAVPWIDIAAVGPLRRCDETNYHVTFCNKGSIDLNGAYASLKLDHGLSMTNCSLPFNLIDSNEYSVNIGLIQAGSCGEFDAMIKTECSVPFPSVKCVYAKLLPDVACGNSDSAYFRRQLAIDGNCYSNDSVYFIIRNTNTSNNHPQSLIYKIFVNDSLAISNQILLQTGDSLELYYPAFGNIIRLEVRYLTYSKEGYQLTLSDCGGSNVNNNTISLSELDGALNEETSCNVISSSLDPNDKEVIPSGITQAHYISSSEELEYTIRFQNTGNDTAFNVIIRDTISSFLNIETLQIMSSNHNFNISMLDGNVIQWIFPNILLPDSTTDERNSHGYIKIKINPKDSLPDFTIINNSASIIFDYNEPVITANTFVTLHDSAFNCTLPISNFSTLIADTSVTFNNLSTFANSIEWNFGDGTTDTSFNAVHDYNVGTFQPCLVTRNICGIDTICETITLIINGIDPPSFDERLAIYPNPNDGHFYLEIHETKNVPYSVYIIDALSQIKLNLKLSPEKLQKIDLKLLPGLYNLIFVDEIGSVISRRMLTII